MSIRLSEKHGVNPSLGVCYFCGEDDGSVMLYGRLKEDAQAPRRAVANMEPCDKCKEWMRQGIIFIGVTDDSEAEIQSAWYEKRPPNPNRTGGFWVLRDDAVKRLFKPEPFAAVEKRRWTFVPEAFIQQMGLMTCDQEGGNCHGGKGE